MSFDLDRNNREFDKQDPEDFRSEHVTIAQRQGESMSEKAKTTQSTTHALSRFGISTLKNWDQTFVNENIYYQGVIFEILHHSCGAVKLIDGYKVYLKAERIIPSEEGLILMGDDTSTLLLPELYSDHQGCYLKSYISWETELSKHFEEKYEHNRLRNCNCPDR
jgi:hypothetical protein